MFHENHLETMSNPTKTSMGKVHLFTAEDYVYRARLAEKALRYEDMLVQMRNVLDLKKKLTADERNLLVVAYKNAVTTRRTGLYHCISPQTRDTFLFSSHSPSFCLL